MCWRCPIYLCEMSNGGRCLEQYFMLGMQLTEWKLLRYRRHRPKLRERKVQNWYRPFPTWQHATVHFAVKTFKRCTWGEPCRPHCFDDFSKMFWARNCIIFSSNVFEDISSSVSFLLLRRRTSVKFSKLKRKLLHQRIVICESTTVLLSFEALFQWMRVMFD